MKIQIKEVPNVCSYCRRIMRQDGYPKMLELYRDDMLCLTVDVEKAAKLHLVENEKEGPIYKMYSNSELKGIETFLNRLQTHTCPNRGDV